jgi:hypothetical protein
MAGVRASSPSNEEALVQGECEDEDVWLPPWCMESAPSTSAHELKSLADTWSNMILTAELKEPLKQGGDSSDKKQAYLDTMQKTASEIISWKTWERGTQLAFP